MNNLANANNPSQVPAQSAPYLGQIPFVFLADGGRTSRAALDSIGYRGFSGK